MLRPWLLQDRVLVTLRKSKKDTWLFGLWGVDGSRRTTTQIQTHTHTPMTRSVTVIWNRTGFADASAAQRQHVTNRRFSRLVVSPGRSLQIQYCMWRVGLQLSVPSVHVSYMFYTFPFAKSWLSDTIQQSKRVALKKTKHVDHRYIIKQLSFINR